MIPSSKLSLKATTSRQDPGLVEHGRELLARTRKDDVEDTFALLQASAKLIGHLFNSVIAAPNAFPLLICGEPKMLDSSILVFLLLLLLEVPETAIERAFSDVDAPPLDSGMVMDQAKKSASHGSWVKAVKEGIVRQYGSVDQYFRTVGVTEASKKCIRDTLLPAASEKSGLLLDLDESDTGTIK